MRKFTFRVFLLNFTLLPLNAFSASKLAKMSEMSWIFLWSEAKLHEKASESFCFHLHHGKSQSEKAFSRLAGEKRNWISPWGAPIIWRYRGKKRKKKIPEHLKTLGGINDGRILISGFYLRRKKEKSKKQHFFTFCSTRGLNPKPPKNGKTGCQTLPPPSFPALGLVPVSQA